MLSPMNKQNTIVYFGQIRPNKGLESIILLGKLIKEKNLSFFIIIMGRTYEKFESYFQKIYSDSFGLPIEWVLNKDEIEVSQVLSENAMAYLPFPDGASERRGSLFAAIQHNMIIFTTKGKHTPPEFDSLLNYVSNPDELIKLLAINNNQLIRFLSNKELDFEKAKDNFLDFYNWETIVEKYIILYDRMNTLISN